MPKDLLETKPSLSPCEKRYLNKSNYQTITVQLFKVLGGVAGI